MTEQVILTLNAGSSSLKFALFTAASQPKRLWSGAIDRIGMPNTHYQLSDARHTVVVDEPGHLGDHDMALTRLLPKARHAGPSGAVASADSACPAAYATQSGWDRRGS